MPNNIKKLLYPMNAAELLDRVIEVYKKSFLKQLAYSAVVSVISFVLLFVLSFIIIIIFAAFVTASVLGPGATYLADGGANAFFTTMLIIVAIIVPFVLLFQSVLSAGHILLAQQGFFDQYVHVPVKQLPGVVFRIISSLVAQVIVSLPLLGLIVLIIWHVINQDYATFGVDFLIVFWFSIVAILFIAYLVLSNVFSLAMAVAVYEKKYFMSTIFRSWELIKGEFWKILGLRTIWFLCIMAISYSFYGVLGILGFLIEFIAGAAGAMAFTIFSSMITGLLNFAVTFLVMPLDGILQATIYYNQRIKKEGLDIHIEIERLNS